MTSSRGMTWLNVPMFTVEDVALNRVEAYTMKGDFVHALRDLNAFVSKRVNLTTTSYEPMTLDEVVEYYSSTGNGAHILDLEPHYKAELEADERKMAMMKCVSQIRRMEFLQEGMRWFDIKRFHLPVTHNIHWERRDIELDRYDKRRALQRPQDAKTVGVGPNER